VEGLQRVLAAYRDRPILTAEQVEMWWRCWRRSAESAGGGGGFIQWVH